MNLEKKIETINNLFQNNPTFSIYQSDNDFYRYRAEFAIQHFNNSVKYVMFDENKKPYSLDQFDIANKLINKLMPIILNEINQKQILSHKLFQIDFLTSSLNESLISFCYHKKLCHSWEEKAQEVSQKLNIKIIGRSRKQKIILKEDFVAEQFFAYDKLLKYKQVENCFTQPNYNICQKMINFLLNKTKNLKGDLLELYCGIGNFTIPLSFNFNKILATEINKTSLKTAKENAKANNTQNVSFVRLSAQETFEALNQTRIFKRLKDVDILSFQFSTILVDPPRSGIGKFGCEFMQKFENIIYISCNYKSLFEDMKILNKTHKVVENAIFDQFPNTEHIELIFILEKISIQ